MQRLLLAHWKLISTIAVITLFALAMWLVPLVAVTLASAAVAAVGIMMIPRLGKVLFGGYYFPKDDEEYYADGGKRKRR